MCMVILWSRYNKKLWGIIPVHFGLSTFRFAYGRTQNIHFYDFWIFGRVPDTQLLLSFATPGHLNKIKKITGTYSEHVVFYKV